MSRFLQLERLRTNGWNMSRNQSYGQIQSQHTNSNVNIHPTPHDILQDKKIPDSHLAMMARKIVITSIILIGSAIHTVLGKQWSLFGDDKKKKKKISSK